MLRVMWVVLMGVLALPAAAFDLQHSAWTGLLAGHVHWNAAGSASAVDYDGLARDRAALSAYLGQLSAVPRSEFDGWAKADRRAFLINAYNAWTVELILRSFPKLKSIKDLGSLFSTPWKQRFFTLFGEQQSLDGIEHGLLRGAADYDDPRVHFAVNCASVGCPALRPEAYRGVDLDTQLDDQTRRFLRDAARNRFDAAERTLYLSPIFDWYESDFEHGWLGADSVAAFVARYPEELALDDASVAQLKGGDVDIEYLDYDWSLNAARP